MREWFPERFTGETLTAITAATAALEAAVTAPDARVAAVGEATRDLERRVDKALPTIYRASFRQTLAALGVALAVALLVRVVLFQPYRIPSGSMKPTLLPGDRVLVWKLPYGVILPLTSIKLGGWRRPARGEVLVFQYPENPREDFVKRVIGLPGDTVAVRGGVVFVNGAALPRAPDGTLREVGREPGAATDFLRFRETVGGVEHPVLYAARGPGSRRDLPPTKVPEGKYFFLGDNRDFSLDSRAWGVVDYAQVRGKATLLYLSLGAGERWSRIGKRVQ
jgi:signal peptidase I